MASSEPIGPTAPVVPAYEREGADLSASAYESSFSGSSMSSPARRTCARCRHRNDADSTFCVNCGLPFEGEQVVSRADDPTIGPNGAPYQGFWIRVVALLIDYIVLYITFIGILAIFGQLEAYFATDDWTQYDTYYGLLFVLYNVVLVGSFGATLGKYIVGIRIVQGDGSRVGYGRALARYLATFLSGLLLGIGFLMVAFSQKKRGLHDVIADTIVVKRR